MKRDVPDACNDTAESRTDDDNFDGLVLVDREFAEREGVHARLGVVRVSRGGRT